MDQLMKLKHFCLYVYVYVYCVLCLCTENWRDEFSDTGDEGISMIILA